MANISSPKPDNSHETESLDFRLESDRLKTFKNWVNDAVTPEALAKAGFYFLNTNYDLVRCAFCKVKIVRWEPGDDPMADHIKWSPRCPFISPLPAGQDVCGTGELFPNSVPEDQTFNKLLKEMIRSHEDFKSRLETFRDWPKSLKQKPKVLAEAGFYYKGVGDQTVCFECGGGIKNWEDDDDPWEQHALRFPKCAFLLQTKGQEYVNEVQRKVKPEERSLSNPSTKEVSAENKSELNGSEEDGKSCKICYNNGIEVVFIPCGHLLACVECASSMTDVCPVCRKRIQATIRVFLS